MFWRNFIDRESILGNFTEISSYGAGCICPLVTLSMFMFLDGGVVMIDVSRLLSPL